jgi:uncharacterized membrane protein
MPVEHKDSGLTRLRRYFITGFIVTAPTILSLYFIWAMIRWVDEVVNDFIPKMYRPSTHLPFDIPGFGLIVVLYFFTLIGYFTYTFMGKYIVNWSHALMTRMPIVRGVYSAVKQVFDAFSAETTSFKNVCLIEYPRRGVWSIGFVTGITRGQVQDVTDDEVLNVFQPTTPNPTSGSLLFVPKKDVIMLDMTVEEGIKMIVSGGIVVPNVKEAPIKKTEETPPKPDTTGKDKEPQ